MRSQPASRGMRTAGPGAARNSVPPGAVRSVASAPTMWAIRAARASGAATRTDSDVTGPSSATTSPSSARCTTPPPLLLS